MSDFKKLKISLEDIDQIIGEFCRNREGILKKEEKPKFIRYILQIPGQKEAYLDVYITKKGTTLNYKTGPNQTLSFEVASLLSEKASKLETVQQSFEGIYDAIFNSLIEYLHQRDYTIKKERQSGAIKDFLTITSPLKEEITLTRYNNYKLLVQGKNGFLFDEIVLWICSKIGVSLDDVSRKYVTSIIGERVFVFPSDQDIENFLDEKVRYKSFLNDEEIIWLQVSCKLLLSNFEAEDYFFAISPSIRIIEGILARFMCTYFKDEFFDKRKGPFSMFEKGKLKENYKSKLANHQVECLEKLYHFLKTRRDSYFHDDGFILPLLTKKEALDILDEIFGLINLAYEVQKS